MNLLFIRRNRKFLFQIFFDADELILRETY